MERVVTGRRTQKAHPQFRLSLSSVGENFTYKIKRNEVFARKEKGRDPSHKKEKRW